MIVQITTSEELEALPAERIDTLLDTREGLALAHGAWREGYQMARRQMKQAEASGIFINACSPYFHPLMQHIKDEERGIR